MDLHIDLRRSPGRTLRGRLEHELRAAIQDGRLPAGARLPATRVLCAQLGVSRGVVQEAYSQLVSEGYLTARRGAGTTVAPRLAGARQPPRRAPPSVRARYDLDPFRPALAGFPRAAWARALAAAIRRLPDERLGYFDPAGAPELREALASYLGRARGVRADPAQILTTSGVRHGLSLVWSALAATGARSIGAERPGWRGVGETATAAGLHVAHVGVDGEGLLTGELDGMDLDAVAVAPAHQYPTGSVLAPGRRADLIAWAQRTGAAVVEDDYDAEYRYDREPVGALQGLSPGEIVYCGSVSKTLAPSLRLGWLAVPPRLIDEIEARQRTLGGGPALPEQIALASMIERGELDRHLRRQRRRYRQRREALLEALGSRLPGLAVRGAAAGLFLVLELPADVDEPAVLAAAGRRAIAIRGAGDAAPAVAIGYANLDPSAASGAVGALAASIEDARVDRRKR